MGAGHTHRVAAKPEDGESARRSLRLAIGLTAAIMLVEFAGGILANSLALVSDAGHMLADVLALAMALFAVSIASRPAPARRTFGYHRVEILSALVNGLLLVVIAIAIGMEAWRRFMAPLPVDGSILLTVAAIGLAANLAGMWMLSRHSESINVRSARMHVASDALSSAGVLLGGLVIRFTGWQRVDPILSAGIAVMILVGAFRILKETVDILLEATPVGMEPEDVCRAIEAVPGVRGVHDLHIWSITSGMIALSGHVILDREAMSRSDDALNRIKGLLQTRFAIAHTTLQIESETYTEVGEVH